MRLGPVLLGACVVVLAVGACSDDGGESASTTSTTSTAVSGPGTSEPPVELAMFWTPHPDYKVVPASATEFDVLYEGSGCSIDGETVALSELARVDVVESADSVSVTVWQRPNDDPRLPQDSNDCLGNGLGIPAHVELAAPLGDRKLVDGFCSVAVPMAVGVSADMRNDLCDRDEAPAP